MRFVCDACQDITNIGKQTCFDLAAFGGPET